MMTIALFGYRHPLFDALAAASFAALLREC
jgi:hypothetical protein